MVKPRRLWRPRLGFHLSVAAGLTYVGFCFLFGRWLSVNSLIFMFAVMVLLGAVLVRLGANIIGGFMVAGFAFLWWYFGMAGPYITLDGLMINLRSPLGIISSAAMLLGIVAGAVDIAEAVSVGWMDRNSIHTHFGRPSVSQTRQSWRRGTATVKGRRQVRCRDLKNAQFIKNLLT